MIPPDEVNREYNGSNTEVHVYTDNFNQKEKKMKIFPVP